MADHSEKPSEVVTEDDLKWMAQKVENHEALQTGATGTFHTLRLGPGEDLLDCLDRYTRIHAISAASIVTCVGSLTKTNLRYANTGVGSQKEGHFEIVSLTGTFGENRRHVHMACSDSEGVTFGGHVLTGNIVYTTAEIVLCVLQSVAYKRETCSVSGWEELKVYRAAVEK